MNDQQRAFLAQANSDYEILRYLKDKAPCHQLHYLQMCTEKLGKAYFKRQTDTKVDGSHAFFVKFLRAISASGAARDGLGFKRTESFEDFIRSLLPLAYDLERIVPDLAGEGPNPEYPFPRSKPTTAPVDYDFSLWRDLQTPRGKRLQSLIGDISARFHEWF